MRLDQLVNSIIYGELAGDALSTHIQVFSNPGVDTLFRAIEAAMTALYVRFPLKYSTRYIQLTPPQTVYNLAASEATTTPTVFLDGVGPEAIIVIDDIASIYEIFSMPQLPVYPAEEELTLLPFNESNNLLSVNTIDPLVLRVPSEYVDRDLILRINYRALPTKLPRFIDLPDDDLSVFWLEIGYQFQDAIVAYSTYKLYSSLDVADAVSLSRRALRRYEAEVLRLSNQGSHLPQVIENTAVLDDGWA